MSCEFAALNSFIPHMPVACCCSTHSQPHCFPSFLPLLTLLYCRQREQIRWNKGMPMPGSSLRPSPGIGYSCDTRPARAGVRIYAASAENEPDSWGRMSAKDDPEHSLPGHCGGSLQGASCPLPPIVPRRRQEPEPTITLTPAKHPCKDIHFPEPQLPRL